MAYVLAKLYFLRSLSMPRNIRINIQKNCDWNCNCFLSVLFGLRRFSVREKKPCWCKCVILKKNNNSVILRLFQMLSKKFYWKKSLILDFNHKMKMSMIFQWSEWFANFRRNIILITKKNTLSSLSISLQTISL